MAVPTTERRNEAGALGAPCLPFRASLDRVTPFDHGLTLDEIRALSGCETVLDLAGNESAYGPSPDVLRALKRALPTGWRYPDPQCRALRERMAEDLGLATGRLSFATGSECLIEFITRAALGPGDAVLLSPPTFPIYANFARILDARVVDVARADGDELDVAAICAALAADPAIRIVFLCNPNNPTGGRIEGATLRAIARAAGPQRLLVLDEAYHEFAALEQPRATLDLLADCGTPFFVLRTFSKAFALGGFRVGYAIASDEATARRLDHVRTQFGVGNLAQVAALAAWQDQAHLRQAVTATRAARDALRGALLARGFGVLKSAANFLLLAVGDQAPNLHQALQRQGVLTRPVGHIGLRVTVGTPAQNEIFLAALDAASRTKDSTK
ncbi:MAG: hisC [Rhodospirillales bacterium]|nr:hisC [Rhodospirillales bacterium]